MADEYRRQKSSSDQQPSSQSAQLQSLPTIFGNNLSQDQIPVAGYQQMSYPIYHPVAYPQSSMMYAPHMQGMVLKLAPQQHIPLMTQTSALPQIHGHVYLSPQEVQHQPFSKGEQQQFQNNYQHPNPRVEYSPQYMPQPQNSNEHVLAGPIGSSHRMAPNDSQFQLLQPQIPYSQSTNQFTSQLHDLQNTAASNSHQNIALIRSHTALRDASGMDAPLTIAPNLPLKSKRGVESHSESTRTTPTNVKHENAESARRSKRKADESVDESKVETHVVQTASTEEVDRAERRKSKIPSPTNALDQSTVDSGHQSIVVHTGTMSPTKRPRHAGAEKFTPTLASLSQSQVQTSLNPRTPTPAMSLEKNDRLKDDEPIVNCSRCVYRYYPYSSLHEHQLRHALLDQKSRCCPFPMLWAVSLQRRDCPSYVSLKKSTPPVSGRSNFEKDILERLRVNARIMRSLASDISIDEEHRKMQLTALKNGLEELLAKLGPVYVLPH